MSEPINIKNLSKPKKAIVAKVLQEDMDWNYVKIGRVLGVSDTTAMRYAEKYREVDTPEKLQEFEVRFRTYAKTKEFEGYNMILDRMLDLIPKERRLDQLVRAGEFLSGKKEQSGIQVNNFNQLLVKFIGENERPDST